MRTSSAKSIKKVKGSFNERQKDFVQRKAEGVLNTQKELQCDFKPTRVTARPTDGLTPDFEKLYSYREVIEQNKDIKALD